jgi:hypothetical protein
MRYLQTFKLHEAKRKTIASSVQAPTGYQDLEKLWSPKWKTRFAALGLETPDVKSGDTDFFMEVQESKLPKRRSPLFDLQDFMDPEENYELGGKDNIFFPDFGASISEDDAYGYKIDEESLDSTPELLVSIKTRTLEEFADQAMALYLDFLQKIVYQKFPPGKHPILQMMTDALSGNLPLNVPSYFAQAVEQDPKSITRLPKMYRAAVSQLVGLSSQEVASSEAAKDFGII